VKTATKSRCTRLIVVTVITGSTLIGFAGPAGAVPVPWKNCGRAGDVVSVQKFDASIWPPRAGKAITLQYQLTVGSDVPRGSTDSISVSPRTYRDVTNKFLFPRSLRGPLKAGPYNVTATFVIPRRVPAGSVFIIHRSAFTPAGRQLLCVDMTLPIK
jgi:hypothetical protein